MMSAINGFKPMNLQASGFGQSNVKAPQAATEAQGVAASGGSASSSSVNAGLSEQTKEISSAQNPSGVSQAYAQASKAYAMMNIQQS